MKVLCHLTLAANQRGSPQQTVSVKANIGHYSQLRMRQMFNLTGEGSLEKSCNRVFFLFLEMTLTRYCGLQEPGAMSYRTLERFSSGGGGGETSVCA